MSRLIASPILLLVLVGCVDHNHNSDIAHKDTQSNHIPDSKIDNTKTLFPITNYPQYVNRWIPADLNYRTPFIDQQKQKNFFTDLQAHYFGADKQDQSPWNPDYIQSILTAPSLVENELYHFTQQFTNPSTEYYGENFRVLGTQWKEQMSRLTSVPVDCKFSPDSRAIAVRETAVRLLPVGYPVFNDPRLAGEGFPFDILQNSAIHPGVPVYIATVTADKAWSFIISPSIMGWVNSADLAKADTGFVRNWTSMAMKAMAGVINNETSFTDDNGVFLFTARTGAFLPVKLIHDKEQVALPVKADNGKAVIHYALPPLKTTRRLPIEPTPENMALLIKNMQGRNYGWGNIYGFNDCSAEIKNLLLPFGIFLPRNSKNQSMSGRRLDLSYLSKEHRIDYLMKYGKPFTTLIYIPGHIMLYMGNVEWQGKMVPLTYQNLWGLTPANSSSRSIIGESVFFPLLTFYPEDYELVSIVEKSLFVLTFID